MRKGEEPGGCLSFLGRGEAGKGAQVLEEGAVESGGQHGVGAVDKSKSGEQRSNWER